ncbi:hypothetical protein J6590_001831 [Homalodisca vitripennis]|nr:hypothetical protein J6590_001831 [Homalodisca vitripennis]
MRHNLVLLQRRLLIETRRGSRGFHSQTWPDEGVFVDIAASSHLGQRDIDKSKTTEEHFRILFQKPDMLCLAFVSCI